MSKSFINGQKARLVLNKNGAQPHDLGIVTIVFTFYQNNRIAWHRVLAKGGKTLKAYPHELEETHREALSTKLGLTND